MKNILAIAFLTLSVAVAQPKPPGAPEGVLPPSGKPLPRMSNGKPDLSGMWVGGIQLIVDFNRPGVFGPPKSAPYKPEARAKAIEAAKDEVADPGVNCLLLGTPRTMQWPFPFKLVQSPKQLVILFEAQRAFRDIPTDGRKHSKDPDDTFMGEPVGSWEGDTLVVDTIGFNDKTWIIQNGSIHSDQIHVVERFTPTADGRIHYEAIAEDPGVLTAKWKVMDGILSAAKGPDMVSEYECLEANRDIPHMRKSSRSESDA